MKAIQIRAMEDLTGNPETSYVIILLLIFILYWLNIPAASALIPALPNLIFSSTFSLIPGPQLTEYTLFLVSCPFISNSLNIKSFWFASSESFNS